MAYNWETKVKIMVPKGTNGWEYSGKVAINGREYAFPVGETTEVPEPVAVLLQKMINEEAALKEIKAKNQHHDPHQHYVTDLAGNPVWEDRTHGGERVTVEWDGTCDKSTDTPGTGSTTMLNGICRYWKISDRVPSKAELFAADTEVVFTGSKAENVTDGDVEGDGYYGRWVLPGTPPQVGEYPCVLVVTKPAKISSVGYNCWEPGIYALTAALGKSLAVQSLTYGWFKQLDEKYIPDSVKVHPDWNQNDETQPDYVKNRTHYSEIRTVKYVDDVTVETTIGEMTENPFTMDMPVKDRTYTVVWDGKEYECIAHYSEDDWVFYLGNGTLAGYNTGNEEPFVIVVDYGYVVVYGETGVHTVSVIGSEEVVQPLAEKFMPKSWTLYSPNDDEKYVIAETDKAFTSNPTIIDWNVLKKMNINEIMSKLNLYNRAACTGVVKIYSPDGVTLESICVRFRSFMNRSYDDNTKLKVQDEYYNITESGIEFYGRTQDDDIALVGGTLHG